MNIVFSPVDDNYIKTMVESGYYNNATEFVRDAVRRMRERGEDGKHKRLRTALEEGMRDIAAGRTVPYTPQLLDEIERSARQHAAEGRKPNPDVLP